MKKEWKEYFYFLILAYVILLSIVAVLVVEIEPENVYYLKVSQDIMFFAILLLGFDIGFYYSELFKTDK